MTHSLRSGWPASWLAPRFDALRVQAAMTTREGGSSTGPYASMNLATHVGDDPAVVAANRAGLARMTGVTPVMLRQVHGRDTVSLDGGLPAPDAAPGTADASVTTQSGRACEIQVADCLPVLLADRAGRVVGAAHAGWRGLAGGVLEACIARMVDESTCSPADLQAWLGPCIGPARFEVGIDVLTGFGAAAASPGRRFVPLRPGKWLADLPGLARDRLLEAGLPAAEIMGNDGSPGWCTVTQADRYFSFRRDGISGRMAALVWLAD